MWAVRFLKNFVRNKYRSGWDTEINAKEAGDYCTVVHTAGNVLRPRTNQEKDTKGNEGGC